MPGARFYAAGFLGSLASGLHLVTQAKVAFEALLGKTSLLHGRTYRAPRLGPMTAVRETAGFGKFFDIGKCSVNSYIGIPQRKAPHPRHIDDAAAAGDSHHFTRNRRMSAFPVAFSHESRRLNFGTDQQIHKTRFTNAAFAQKHANAAGRHARTNLFDAFGIFRRNN